MEVWVAVLAAVIGGTGIAGIITASVDMSQAARLRRVIENLDFARSKSPKGSKSRALAERAIQVETVRMASFSRGVRRRPMAWFYIGLVLLLIGAFVAIGSVWAPTSSWLEYSNLITFAAGYLIALSGMVCAVIWFRADRRARNTHQQLVKLGLADDDSTK